MAATAIRSGGRSFHVAGTAALRSSRLAASGSDSAPGARSYCTGDIEEVATYKSDLRPQNFAPGIYKAILIGQVGQPPSMKTLANGAEVVSFALGTGGLRNNRKAREGESMEAYEERSFTQWHKICVFKPSLLSLAKQIKKGMNVYVEGNIETRLFKDPVTGTQKRVREISVRQNGRLYMTGAKPLLAPDFGS